MIASIIVSILVLLLVMFILGSIWQYVPIIERNAFDVPRLQVPQDVKPHQEIEYRSFQIPYDTENAIEAQYVTANQPDSKLVVFCHETGADLNSWYKHARFLPDNGIDVLTFNFKLAPLSKEKSKTTHYQWPSFKDLKCLERVLSWVAVEKKGYEVALFGVSKGATVAAAAAPSPLIKSVLLDGAFSTHWTLQKYMKKWVNIYVTPRTVANRVPDWIYLFLSYSTLVYAGFKKRLRFYSIEKFAVKVEKPVFMIHAGKDYHVQLEHVEKLRRIFPGKTDLWVAERAGHSEAVQAYPEEYTDKVVNFLTKTL